MAEEIQKKSVNEIGKVTHSDGVVLGVQGGKAVTYGVNEEGGLVTTDKVSENLTFGGVKKGDNNVVSGGDVYTETLRQEDVDIFKIYSDTNLIKNLVTSDFNSDLFSSGYLDSQGVQKESAGYVFTEEYYRVKSGKGKIGVTVASNACVVFYNKDKEVVYFIKKNADDGFDQFFERIINLPEETYYVRFSFFKNGAEMRKCYLTFDDDFTDIGDNVFLPTKDFNEKTVTEKFKKWGRIFLQPNQNSIEDISKSDFTDATFWVKDSFLYNDGRIGESSSYQYTLDYFTIPNGLVNLNTWITGNASIVFYDIDKNVVGGFNNTVTSVPNYNGEITIPKGAVYLRMSFPYYYASQLKNVFLKKNEYVEIDLNNTNTSGVNVDFLRETNKLSYPMPIITFISDDGNIENKDWYVPILDNAGVKGTFAIITSKVGGVGMLSKQEIIDIHLDGHDIAGHTHTHPFLGRDGTEESVNNELYLNSTILRSWRTDLKARMFVAPFGSVNTMVDNEIRKFFDCDFQTNITEQQINSGISGNLPPINRYRIRRVSFDAGGNDLSKLEICKKAVDNVLISGGWLVFAVHPHYNEYKEGNTIDRKQELADLLDYIKTKNIGVLTAQQAFDIYKNVFERNNESINQNDFFSMGMDGSVKGTLK